MAEFLALGRNGITLFFRIMVLEAGQQRLVDLVPVEGKEGQYRTEGQVRGGLTLVFNNMSGVHLAVSMNLAGNSVVKTKISQLGDGLLVLAGKRVEVSSWTDWDNQPIEPLTRTVPERIMKSALCPELGREGHLSISFVTVQDPGFDFGRYSIDVQL